jgi:hypothetical protein
VINLRPHHLLCLLTFVGRGYSDSFALRLLGVVESLKRGTPARLIAGPDSICAGLLGCRNDDGHCRQESVTQRDETALTLLQPFFEHRLEPGAEIPNLLARRPILRAAYREGAFQAACDGCPWQGFCRQIAEGSYQDTRF